MVNCNEEEGERDWREMILNLEVKILNKFWLFGGYFSKKEKNGK